MADDNDYERILCVKNEVFVFRIPPRTTNRGYRYVILCRIYCLDFILYRNRDASALLLSVVVVCLNVINVELFVTCFTVCRRKGLAFAFFNGINLYNFMCNKSWLSRPLYANVSSIYITISFRCMFYMWMIL